MTSAGTAPRVVGRVVAALTRTTPTGPKNAAQAAPMRTGLPSAAPTTIKSSALTVRSAPSKAPLGAALHMISDTVRAALQTTKTPFTAGLVFARMNDLA
ncbi:hypothetical protein CEP88_14965 [Roseobacter denitrificans]|nr:hypothetical protein CEP88_14965 [Roseobacter denitrificans]